MLPQFPQFKNLELSDKLDVEAITSKYPPYSDFNFVSMWGWDIKNEMKISELNGNLVVLFTDYVTGEPFYSFLGSHKVNETAEELALFSKKEGLGATLKLIPKDSLKHIDSSLFVIEDDRNNFDYIYETEHLSTCRGNKYEVKRTMMNSFCRAFVFEVKKMDLNDPDIQKQITELNQIWMKNKVDNNKQGSHEDVFLERVFQVGNYDDFLTVGIYIDGKLAGCSINEVVSTNYIISHFFKGIEPYKGLNAQLMKEVAKQAFDLKKVLLNFEQDLGIPGLQKAKTLWRPIGFLKKFTLIYRK